MIVQLDQLYVDAMKRRYIVGAFNVFNYCLLYTSKGRFFHGNGSDGIIRSDYGKEQRRCCDSGRDVPHRILCVWEGCEA